MLTIGHEVVRPGRHWGDSEVNIPVPEELETVLVFLRPPARSTGTPASIRWKP